MARVGAALLAAALCLVAADSAYAQQRQVLVLAQNPEGVAHDQFVEAVRAAVDAAPGSINWFSEALDFARFPGLEYEATMTTYLRAKYANKTIDVVVAAGPEPLFFLRRHRDSLFPGTPIVFGGVRDTRVRTVELPRATTGVTGGFDVVETLELAIALQPDARQVVVLTGVSAFDAEWRALAQDRLQAYRDRFEVTFISEKPVALLLEELGRLPRNAIVIVLSFAEDAAGERFIPPRDLVTSIAAASSAPVYGVYEQFVGAGVVGGHVDRISSAGAAAGELVARILDGESADELPLRRAPEPFVVDWRQLRRWDLDESRLPSGTIVEFEAATLWDQYQTEILGALALIALQTLLLIVLLLRARKRRAERALQETEERYRNVVESQSDLICRYLPDGTLTFVNEAYCRYFGRPRDDLVGTRFLELLPEAEREKAIAHVRSLIAAPRREIYTHRALRPDGTMSWQQWVDHVIPGEDGRASELQGVGRDVTELKNAETEAHERREQVTHLTRVAVLGELSGALAHELNQPLTAILSNAQAAELLLARDEIDLEEIREILADIVNDDMRAGEVIMRLRELLKRGKSELQPLDVNSLVGEVLTLAHAQLVAQHIQVASQLGTVPRSQGDRVQLQQVLLNLVLNACEAMEAVEPAERTLAVSTFRRDGYINVTIVDSGSGLAPEVVDRLFEPFVTTKAKGLGLGLSICRSIVAAHGGQLSATNNVGRGATFELKLPARGDIAEEYRPS
jgi:PAS domain S-box-containing protein